VTPFEGVAGHEQPLRLLESQLERGRLSHAYLFVGEPGLGKTTVGRRLAQALLPEVPLDRHPDYWEDDRIKGIRIDEIRLIPEKSGPEAHDHTLQQFINLKPGVGRYRVAVISNVGRLADPVQGVLLKTLEEPHPNRVIILTTPSLSPFVVLPTVASRCQRIAFQPVAAHAIEQLLVEHGVAPSTAAVLAQLARGRPGWALNAARDASVVERHRHWSERLDQLFGAPADVALNVAAELDAAQMAWRNGEKDSEDPVLFALSSWQLDLRRRMLSDTRPASWARLLELSYDTVGYLEQNVSPRLALECFLLECRKAS
jgi:DNA polymerase-3 subunit delta'